MTMPGLSIQLGRSSAGVWMEVRLMTKKNYGCGGEFHMGSRNLNVASLLLSSAGSSVIPLTPTRRDGKQAGE